MRKWEDEQQKTKNWWNCGVDVNIVRWKNTKRKFFIVFSWHLIWWHTHQLHISIPKVSFGRRWKNFLLSLFMAYLSHDFVVDVDGKAKKRGSRVWMICSQNLTLNLFWRSSRLNLKSYVICLLCSESTRKRNEIIPFRPSLVRLRGLCQLTSCHSLVPPLSSSLTMEYHPPEYVVYEKSSEKVSRWWSMSSFKPEKCNIFFLYRTTTRKLNSLVDEEQILPQPKRI